MKRTTIDKNIRVGDYRRNTSTKHPCIIVGDSLKLYPIVGFTHHPTTNSQANVFVKRNGNEKQYCRNHFDFVEESKISEKYINPILNKTETDALLRKINHEFKYIDQISKNKIK